MADKVIDPGAEFSKPRNEKLNWIIDLVERLPDRTLPGGEGAILVAEIRRLERCLTDCNAKLIHCEDLLDAKG